MSIITEYQKYLVLNRGLAQSTAMEYGKDLREIQKWMVKQAKIERWSDVTKENIDDYVADMSQQGQKPATISRRVSTLRGFYQFAWVKGLTKENPAKYVSTPKVGETMPKTLNPAEIKAAISDTRIDATTRVMITILAETGIRISELRAIRWWDVNQQERTITIHGKGNKERRVYYGNGTAEIFQHVNVSGSTQLFTMDDRDARYRIYLALRQHTNAEKCSCHVIRHTYATELLNAGADINDIKELMGHASVTTTERYAKVAGAKVAATYKQYATNYGN